MEMVVIVDEFEEWRVNLGFVGFLVCNEVLE